MPVSVTIVKGNQTYTLEQFGVACKKHNIPPLPEKEIYTMQVPGRAGKVRMGAQYLERSFSLECILMADDPTVDYQMRLAAVAELLDTIAEPAYWVFGDMPGKRWQAEYVGSMTIEKMIFDGEFTIPLISYFPWPESITDVSNGWEYEQGYTYGMSLEYGGSLSFSITSSPTSFNVNHAGNVPLPPKIKITGQFTNLVISDGRGTALEINRVNGGSDTIEVDCEEGRVILNGSQSIYGQTNKHFFVLPHGDTIFTVTSTGTVNCIIEFTPFRHRYLY